MNRYMLPNYSSCSITLPRTRAPTHPHTYTCINRCKFSIYHSFSLLALLSLSCSHELVHKYTYTYKYVNTHVYTQTRIYTRTRNICIYIYYTCKQV